MSAAAVDTQKDLETKTRLIRAAERLVARRGVDGVSVRGVCRSAGLNVAAVHYHFGSKEALLAAVLATRMAEVSGRRLELLDRLDDKADPTAVDVARALVTPLAEVAGDPDGADYVHFLRQMNAAGPAYRQQLGAAFGPQLERLLGVLQRALPDLEPSRLTYRLELASEVLLTALSEPHRELADGSSRDVPPYDPAASTLVDFVAGALAGPDHTQ